MLAVVPVYHLSVPDPGPDQIQTSHLMTARALLLTQELLTINNIGDTFWVALAIYVYWGRTNK